MPARWLKASLRLLPDKSFAFVFKLCAERRARSSFSSECQRRSVEPNILLFKKNQTLYLCYVALSTIYGSWHQVHCKTGLKGVPTFCCQEIYTTCSSKDYQVLNVQRELLFLQFLVCVLMISMVYRVSPNSLGRHMELFTK